MLTLGIETSCDETAVAIYDSDIGLIFDKIYSQSLHSKYGGVVPELASRDHLRKIISLIRISFLEYRLCFSDIDVIAYTAGPGLIGSLLVGATIACTLGFALNLPVIPINHLEAHIHTPMMEGVITDYPFISLLVSGGHTQLIYVKNFRDYELLGQSIDDAAGEAFDKVAKLLGLQYPGGKLLSDMARHGKLNKFIFPRPMLNKDNLNFSFSGIKTFALNILKNIKYNIELYADIARAFEDAMIDVLVNKCISAIKKTGLKRVVLVGGVSANDVLRDKLSTSLKLYDGKAFYSSKNFCTDNAAMIAYTGMIHFFNKNIHDNKLNIKVYPRWSLV
ncbi:tRNA (adenosine(37)-N6)-threonylcarbamoyltransferase complex transferase subunit TsaD [Candidatus Purcelliella pentastirinorum]|uniref:tRNA (adenosine(37)-N6)-threonylcarbamoyltransferase complex transferase subunit TsaD n=1 Tax=Candidatus Purcelliella pentastirinorum TaxID=472834 RepID=UPI002368C21F|nr:tRNA (adenosine(37)-N6)-threonylcarbamoyltransferase complex transferase subunit TsaD [Candidatus Purcelliella pentastirinorum]WDI78897.1 tRNA (adenosine(37)-N6)-threonylcarbamoyltransferase complex transferase subunit TsaD [Candidatus Purcelliella pentastirinorum]WDR80031.1 tRNA (adenosine(37)-N6)-threonylcarbamoyltransferase complex transferase subunit TsaD [Candidatus Purcelliella pentastirinorum]